MCVLACIPPDIYFILLTWTLWTWARCKRMRALGSHPYGKCARVMSMSIFLQDMAIEKVDFKGKYSWPNKKLSSSNAVGLKITPRLIHQSKLASALAGLPLYRFQEKLFQVFGIWNVKLYVVVIRNFRIPHPQIILCPIRGLLSTNKGDLSKQI